MNAKLLGWFPCRETSGNILHDSVNEGLTWDISARGDTLTYVGNGIGCTDNSDDPVNFTGGNCPVIRTDRDYLYFCVGKLLGAPAFRCSIGDINELLPEYFGIGIGFGAADAPFHSAIGYHSAQLLRVREASNRNLYQLAQPTPFDVLVAIRYSGINNTLLYEAYDVVTSIKVMEALTYTHADSMSDFQPNPCFRFAGIELYGVAMIEFTQFPSDVITGALSMATQWRIGKSTRTLYAPWFPPPITGLSMQ